MYKCKTSSYMYNVGYFDIFENFFDKLDFNFIENADPKHATK